MPELETQVGADSALTAPPVTAETSATATTETVGSTDSQATQEQGNSEQKPEETKRLGGWQRAKIKAEQERDYWREIALKQLQPQPVEAKAAPTTTEKPEPKPEDFAIGDTGTYDVAAYTKALVAHNRELAKAELREEMRQAEEAKTKKSAEQQQMSAWDKQLQGARTKYTDFDDVVSDPSLPITKTMLEAMMSVDGGAEAAYHLGTHPDEAHRISQLSPIQQVIELGKLQARIAGQPPAAATTTEAPAVKATEPPVSKAPQPPSLPSKPSATDSMELDDKLPAEEWSRRFKARLEKSRR